MSLSAQIEALVTRVADEFNDTYGQIGDLTTLTTTAKGSLVAAINEIDATTGGGGGVTIDDTTPSLTTVYSSTKTNSQITTQVGTAITALVDGAPGQFDTLKELADAMAGEQSATAAFTTALGNRVRFDAAQTLTAPQKAQAIANIGAISAADVGSVATDFVAVFEAALV